MTYHMAVFSIQGTLPQHRYDFITTAKPGGIAYYRSQSDFSRSRWRRITLDLKRYPLNLTSDLVAGPTLMEITAEEAQAIENGGAMHPPRNVGLRAEKIRTNWNDGHLPVGRLDSWLTDWRNATRDGDHLWIGARTHRHGRVRQQNPFALGTTSVPAETSPLNAASTATSAVPGGNSVTITSVVKKSYVYEPVVKGTVRRPNGENYRVRKVGKHQDVQVFRTMREHGVHCLTTGVPGTGKSALMEAAFGDQMITVLGTEDLEAADLQGSYVEIDNAWVWVDGPLVIALEQGLVFYLDEIGVVRAKQVAQLYAIMDGRGELLVTANPKRGIIKAAPGFMVVASTNPESAEVRMTDAVMNRFGLKLEVTTDYAMARAHFGLPEWIVNASENLELRRRTKEISWAPQTRDLLLFRTNSELLGEVEAGGVMINSAPAAARGTVAEVLSKTSGKKMKALVLT